VALELERYIEPLDAGELEFLEQKESKDRKLYYKIFQFLMFLSFIISYAVAWIRALGGRAHAFSPLRFFISVGVLLSLSLIATFIVYCFDLRRVQKDIAGKTKTVEINHVMRKAYFPAKSAYYFYIDSKIKLSIEVSYEDFTRMAEGDEVCIEYTTHSKEYLGYF